MHNASKCPTIVRSVAIVIILLGSVIQSHGQERQEDTSSEGSATAVNLGEFSISLAVRDLGASKAFYEKLGFAQMGGDTTQGWVLMSNGSAAIGLFQGMFEGNILTFNPSDVRGVQRLLKEEGIPLLTEADESTEGPAHILVQDPDGNIILLDQF